MGRYEHKAFWDSVWDRSQDPLPQQRIETHQLARRLIPADVQTIVDVGCGSGAFTNSLIPDYSVVGVDFNEAALRTVETETRLGRITDIPAADREFDLVVAMQVLEHLPHDGSLDKAAAELARVARRYVLVTVPAHDDPVRGAVRCSVCRSRFHVGQHVRFFSRSDFAGLIPGFELVTLAEAGRKYIGSRLMVELAMAASDYTGAPIPGAPCLVCGSTMEMVRVRESAWSTVFMGADLLLLSLKRILRLGVSCNHVALYQRRGDTGEAQ